MIELTNALTKLDTFTAQQSFFLNDFAQLTNGASSVLYEQTLSELLGI